MTITTIGIHGPKGSGKNLTARMLGKFFPEVREFAFADALKGICAEAYNVPLLFFYDEDYKEKPLESGQFIGLTPRALMTRTADMFKASYGADFFVIRLKNQMDEMRVRIETMCPKVDTLFVITDVRHEEEASMVRTIGRVLHIDGPDHYGYLPDTHVSEQTIRFNMNDVMISNRADFAALMQEVRELLTRLRLARLLDPFPFVPGNDSLMKEFQLSAPPMHHSV